MARYKTYNEGQHYFELIDIENELPSDNRARIIKEIICSIDISDFDKNYNNDKSGACAENVYMMLGILLLAFVRNITGSRSITSYFATDLEFKYILSGSKAPDDSTIREFRRRHVKELGQIFSLSVHLGSSFGMTDFGALAIDGTKIQAYASFFETKDREMLNQSINRLSKQMENTIKRLNSSEDNEEIDELKERLKSIEKRETVLQEFGKLLDDKEDNARVNRIDPDARLMKKSDGKVLTGYNAQVGVDCGGHGLIVSAEVSQDATDEKLLGSMIDNSEEETDKKYKTVLADSGYITYEALAEAAHKRRDILGPDRLYEKDKYGTHKSSVYSKSEFKYDHENDCYYCPAGQMLEFKYMIKENKSKLVYVYENKVACVQCKKASMCIARNGTFRRIRRDYREMLREKLRHRLDSKEGYQLYSKRAPYVESVFGNIKQNKRMRQFYYRGIDKVRTEWKLICSGINFNKIIQFLQDKDWRYLIKEALNA